MYHPSTAAAGTQVSKHKVKREKKKQILHKNSLPKQDIPIAQKPDQVKPKLSQTESNRDSFESHKAQNPSKNARLGISINPRTPFPSQSKLCETRWCHNAAIRNKSCVPNQSESILEQRKTSTKEKEKKRRRRTCSTHVQHYRRPSKARGGKIKIPTILPQGKVTPKANQETKK